MSQIINLRTRRKQAARAAARVAASQSATRHGEAKAARNLREARAEIERRNLDAHHLAPDAKTDG